MNSIARFLMKALNLNFHSRRSTRRRARSKCLVLHRSDDLSLDFVLAALTDVFEHHRLVEIDLGESDYLYREEYIMIYIGHDQTRRTEGSEVAMKVSYLPFQIQKAEQWACSPLVWWSCYSAFWARGMQRGDWCGFSGILGYDLRSKKERNWWHDHVVSVVGTLVLASEGLEPRKNVFCAAKEEYRKALDNYKKGKGRTWMTVLLARAFARHIELGPHLGI